MRIYAINPPRVHCYRQEGYFSRIFMVLQREESIGRVDHAIKGLEYLHCITEGKPRNIKIGYSRFSINQNIKNPELLRNNVKRVIGIIVGLLKDRVSVDRARGLNQKIYQKVIEQTGVFAYINIYSVI